MGIANFDVFRLYPQPRQLPHSFCRMIFLQLIYEGVAKAVAGHSVSYEFTNRDGAKFTEQVLELPLAHRRR